MAVTAQDTQMESLTITFPKVDMKRLIGIVKAMGWSIETDDYYESPQFYADLEQAKKDIAEGKGIRISSVEQRSELLK